LSAHIIQSYQLFHVVDAKSETIGHVKTYARHGVRWLTDVWVDPEHRCQGLATRLIREALAAHVGEAIYLDVHGYTNRPLSDEQLTAWYSTFGFGVVAGAPGMLVRPAAWVA
jgi:ribosomal protein S18 acetylase RimI-like enzyme